MVDAINPLLRLNDNTSVLGHIRRAVSMLLTLLDRDASVLTVATVHLQVLLVRLEIESDTRYVRVHGQDRQVRGFGGGVTWTVQDEGGVVTRAAKPTGVYCCLYILPDLLRLGEIEGSAFGDAYSAIWD